MGEPEDLIIDGAYIASRLARDAWRRYSPPRPARVLCLADVRLRLELILNGLFEARIAVAAAEPPAPVSWLARLAGHAADSTREVPAGTDGTRVFLPATWDASAGADLAFQAYVLLAVAQAARLARGSTAIVLGIRDDDVRDRFLIADGHGVDQWIVREAPGLVPALRAARLDALAQRPSAWPRSEHERAAEEQLRAFLASDPLVPFEDVPRPPRQRTRSRGRCPGRPPRGVPHRIAHFRMSIIGVARRRRPLPAAPFAMRRMMTGIPGARPTGASPRCAAAREFARQTSTKTTAAQARG